MERQKQKRQHEEAEQQQQRERQHDERMDKFVAQVLNGIATAAAAAAAAAVGGAAAQLAPTLTLTDLPEAGLSKLQEAARSRLPGSSDAEAQVGASAAQAGC